MLIGLEVARATRMANTPLFVCTFFSNRTICSQFRRITPATSQRFLCCLVKQYWGSDSRSRIIWILIIELPFGSVARSSQHFVCHMAESVEDLWGSEKWAQPNKGMCGTSHPFLLRLTAIIVWKCRRQPSVLGRAFSNSWEAASPFCAWEWRRRMKRSAWAKIRYEPCTCDRWRFWPRV